jgi:ABC-type sugar transport system substrate-binding protein
VFSEPMAYGVLDAVDYTKIKKPIIVAFDGTESGKKMIEKGSFDAIVDQKPYEMGRMATEYALRLIKGEKIPSPGLTHTELITIESVTRPFKK